MAAAHDLLATIYLQSGKAEDAVQQSKLALSSDPTDQVALYHLIMAMRKSNHNDEVPDLLKRLAQLKGASQEEESKRVSYRLIEEPAEPEVSAK